MSECGCSLPALRRYVLGVASLEAQASYSRQVATPKAVLQIVHGADEALWFFLVYREQSLN